LPFTPNLKASKFFPEPNQSIRRERDEGFPKLASLHQSRGPVVASIESLASSHPAPLDRSWWSWRRRRWRYMETDDRGRRGRLDDGREGMSGLEGRRHVVI